MEGVEEELPRFKEDKSREGVEEEVPRFKKDKSREK